MPKVAHPVTIKYIAEIKKALKEFGEHNYYDKGADEVMVVNPKPFLALKQSERLQVVKELMAYKHGQPFCEELASSFDFARENKNPLSEDDANELMDIIEPQKEMQPVDLKPLGLHDIMGMAGAMNSAQPTQATNDDSNAGKELGLIMAQGTLRTALRASHSHLTYAGFTNAEADEIIKDTLEDYEKNKRGQR